MNFLLFFYRFFSILTFFYPPRCVSCCLSDSCEFFILLLMYPFSSFQKQSGPINLSAL